MRFLKKLLNITLLLAFVVLGLGAYTRLTNAGLGCPDWPGCYGQVYPHLDSAKAWTEMIHRYLAGTLGVCVFLILMMSYRLKRQGQVRSLALPLFLAAWIIFQALLGMWTVTWRLLPIVVMGHLLSGSILFMGLSLYRASLASSSMRLPESLHPWLLFAACLVFCQMALGGWVSANYAGVSCIGFPTCQGRWFPLEGLKQGFFLFSSVNETYEGGILQHQSRVAIQVLHRIGAGVVVLYLSGILGWLFQARAKCLATIILGLIILQLALGVVNVLYFLPLPVAVMHNLVAVLLLTLLSLSCFWSRKQK